MAVDERSRHQLYQRLQEVLGAEEATTLMAHLPPGGVGELATKGDLRVVRESLEHKIELLDHKMEALRLDPRGDMFRNSRNMILAFTAIVAAMNGLLAAFFTLGM